MSITIQIMCISKIKVLTIHVVKSSIISVTIASYTLTAPRDNGARVNHTCWIITVCSLEYSIRCLTIRCTNYKSKKIIQTCEISI